MRWLLVLLACGTTGDAEPKVEPVAPGADPRATVRPEGDDALSAALRKIHDSGPPCLGPLAKVQVFRDPDGEVGALYYSGDLRLCSHPPSIYFDAGGREQAVVRQVPITDANRAEFEALHERHRGGLEPAEVHAFGE